MGDVQRTPNFAEKTIVMALRKNNIPKRVDPREPIRNVDEGKFVYGLNIRRDTTEAGVWRPAGIPSKVRNDSWVPLQGIGLHGTPLHATFMQSGHTLGVIVDNGNSREVECLKGSVTAIGILNGTPLRFDVVTPGIVRVLMRHSRTIYLSYRMDGGGTLSWEMHGPMPALPPLSITSCNETTLSESFGAMSLSGSGATRGSLPPADERIVSEKVKSAYARLKSKASDMGLYLQPTLARYRVIDAWGDTMAVSPPVMVGAPGGFQGSGELRLTSTDGLTTLSGGAVTARGYMLCIEGFAALPHPWRQLAKKVVIETVPQIDPVNPEISCPMAITTNGATVTVAVHLAGYSATSAANSLRQRNLIVSALAHAHTNYLAQGTFTYPFREMPSETRVGLREDAPLWDETEEPKGYRHMPWRDNTSFGACHSTGDRLVLADRRIEPFAGYAPGMYAAEIGKGNGDTCVAIVSIQTVNNAGSNAVAVATAEGKRADITAISPLLVYPDSEASKITFTIARGDEILTETYPLTPLPDAGVAYYLSPAMQPMQPRGKTDQITVPEPTPPTGRITVECGKIAICASSRLGAPLWQEACTHGEIVAIADAPRSRSTWDFSHRKLLLFGSDGTHVAALDTKGAIRSVAQLDTRPVNGTGSICVASGKNGKTLIAVAGADLIEAGQSSVTTLVRHCRGEHPGWCGRFGEIWLGGGEGPLRRITFNGKNIEELEASFGSPELIPLQWGARLLLTGSRELLDTHEEVFPAGGMPIRIETRHLTDKPLTALRLNLFASTFDGTITITGDNGTRIGQTLTSIKAKGSLNAPLNLRVVAPHRKWIGLRLDAKVSSDTEWHSPELGTQK